MATVIGGSKPSIGETKLETQQIKKLLLELSDGDVLTYETIRAKVGVDVQGKYRGLLRTAIKNAERESSRLYGTVHKVGVKRLHPGQSSGELTKVRDHMRHTARRAFRRSECIEFDKLTAEEKATLNCEITILHFVAESTTEKSTQKIANVVQSTGDAMSFAKVLEHFKQ